MGSEDLAEYAVVSSRLLLYLVEPVRVVRLCLRVGFSRLMRRLICCCCWSSTRRCVYLSSWSVWSSCVLRLLACARSKSLSSLNGDHEGPVGELVVLERRSSVYLSDLYLVIASSSLPGLYIFLVCISSLRLCLFVCMVDLRVRPFCLPRISCLLRL